MDWGAFLDDQAAQIIGHRVDQITQQAPAATTAGGVRYVEGKPAAPMQTKTISGISPALLYGGAALLLVGGFLLLRKK